MLISNDNTCRTSMEDEETFIIYTCRRQVLNVLARNLGSINSVRNISTEKLWVFCVAPDFGRILGPYLPQIISFIRIFFTQGGYTEPFGIGAIFGIPVLY